MYLFGTLDPHPPATPILGQSPKKNSFLGQSPKETVFLLTPSLTKTFKRAVFHHHLIKLKLLSCTAIVGWTREWA